MDPSGSQQNNLKGFVLYIFVVRLRFLDKAFDVFENVIWLVVNITAICVFFCEFIMQILKNQGQLSCFQRTLVNYTELC